jgi:hypothetical protein
MTHPTPDRQSEERRRGIAAYQGALEAVLAIVITAAVGYWADQRFGTAPRWLILGTCLLRGFRASPVPHAQALRGPGAGDEERLEARHGRTKDGRLIVRLDPMESLNFGISAGAVAAGFAFASPGFAASLAFGAAIEAANFRALRAAANRMVSGELAMGRLWAVGFGLRFGFLAVAISLALNAGAPVSLVIGLSTTIPGVVLGAIYMRPPSSRPGRPPPDDPAGRMESVACARARPASEEAGWTIRWRGALGASARGLRDRSAAAGERRGAAPHRRDERRHHSRRGVTIRNATVIVEGLTARQDDDGPEWKKWFPFVGAMFFFILSATCSA